MIGIYRIRNVVNEKCYYGSSKDIDKRWKRHINELNSGKHHNIILQRSWDKYGTDMFSFELIEECTLDELLIREQVYLDTNPYYNIGKTASGGDNLTNNPNREEIIENIKKGTRLRYSNLTSEEIKAIHSRPGETNHNWRGGTSIGHCACGKEIGPNNKTCIDCYDKTGESNPFYGKHHTEENKKYLSELFKGKHLSNNNIFINIDGIEYESFKEAERLLGIGWGTIRHRVLSLNPKYVNYNFKGEIKICHTKEELKKKHGEKQIGKPVLSNNKPFFIDDIEYRTLGDASLVLGISKMTIKGRILSKREEFSNYKYK